MNIKLIKIIENKVRQMTKYYIGGVCGLKLKLLIWVEFGKGLGDKVKVSLSINGKIELGL